MHLINNKNDDNEREDLVLHLVFPVNVICVNTKVGSETLKFGNKQADKGGGGSVEAAWPSDWSARDLKSEDPEFGSRSDH